MKSLSGKLGVILVVIGLTISGYTEVRGADWKLYGRNQLDSLYYDRDSLIKPSKGVVRVWVQDLNKRDMRIVEKEIADEIRKLDAQEKAAKEAGDEAGYFELLRLKATRGDKMIELENRAIKKKIILYEINCSLRTYTTLKYIAYDKDEKVLSEWINDSLRHIQPDTDMEKLHKNICR